MNPGNMSKAERLAAFERLVATYEGPLLRYAGRILLNQTASQDVVQNTFVRLYRRWEGDWEPSPPVSSWLYRVAHNCAVDHLRKESRRRLLHLRQAEERPVSAAPNRGEGFHISERAERAAQALKTLSLREQQLVILKIYEEKSYREIGDITGLSTSNVGYILHHAMKKMAAALGRTGDAAERPGRTP